MERTSAQTALHKNIHFFFHWTIISGIMGVLCGLVGSAFGHGVHYAQVFFNEHDFMLYLMPVSGVLIVIVHKVLKQVGNKGTNLILESIHGSETVNFTLLPTIFISTILSHFVHRPVKRVPRSRLVPALQIWWGTASNFTIKIRRLSLCVV